MPSIFGIEPSAEPGQVKDAVNRVRVRSILVVAHAMSYLINPLSSCLLWEFA